ncbi:PREDICTED: zinc finger protein 177-like isoform X1 [Rhagoletis zephyria]|uniref:zinc finger protein 177-like isoform X1 n=1 Tax=Rhagoletis zephyria TaxID=28612 RepID=UPI00081166FE|nr:PREDICTED: zinc finger protein 177-like isoform X1 [Rhagoletis zephyria]XP_017473843.1 PREDICTED: zinc finger protein 177-like isoform X1 [Rhagoletis zephyria]
MAATTVQKFHCGEVFVSANLCVTVECKWCNEKFGVYSKFLDHIFGEHFDDWNSAEETKRQLPNKVETVTDEDFTESPNEIQYIEIEPISLNEYSFEGDEQEEDFITEKLAPMDDDAINVSENITEEQEEKRTPKTSQPTWRPVRVFATYKNSTAIADKRKYKCKICGFAVTDIHNLRGHEKRHSNIKPYTCLKCDKAFYTRTELNTHTRRHNGEKPFVCSYCGKSFITAAILTRHEKRHLGKREHKCDQCEKSFFDGFQLRDHAVVHTQERNYECETCKAKFTRKKTLKTHMKLHENALGYECIICHMRFNQRPTLLWHVKTKHSVLRADTKSKDSITATENLTIKLICNCMRIFVALK